MYCNDLIAIWLLIVITNNIATTLNVFIILKIYFKRAIEQTRK